MSMRIAWIEAKKRGITKFGGEERARGSNSLEEHQMRTRVLPENASAKRPRTQWSQAMENAMETSI